mgnify:CR=1 FL=1
MKSLLTLCLLGLVVATSADELYIIDTHTHFKGEAQIKRQVERGQKKDPKNTLTQVVTAEDYRVVADRLNICLLYTSPSPRDV